MKEKLTTDDDGMMILGPIRRNLKLLIAVAATLAIAPSLNRLMTSYRAIVLERSGEVVLVAQETRPPEWVDAVEAAPGEVLVKDAGDWSSRATEPGEQDGALVKLYERYIAVYDGTVVKILKRQNTHAADAAIIETGDGRSFRLEIWADHLIDVKIGSRLRKVKNSWDPELVTATTGDAVEFNLPDQVSSKSSEAK
jgi:hypothetical protein